MRFDEPSNSLSVVHILHYNDLFRFETSYANLPSSSSLRLVKKGDVCELSFDAFSMVGVYTDLTNREPKDENHTTTNIQMAKIDENEIVSSN